MVLASVPERGGRAGIGRVHGPAPDHWHRWPI